MEFSHFLLGTRLFSRAFNFPTYPWKEKCIMDYGMIWKIEKAKLYAQERNRVHFEALTVTFNGDNSPHTVQYKDGNWQCNCDFFQSRGRCCHTMALEMILEGMIITELVEVK